jgi:hypothetical protein
MPRAQKASRGDQQRENDKKRVTKAVKFHRYFIIRFQIPYSKFQIRICRSGDKFRKKYHNAILKTGRRISLNTVKKNAEGFPPAFFVRQA